MVVEKLPSPNALAWPTLEAIRASGGAADIRTIADRVGQALDLSPQQRTIPHGSGRRTMLDYRLAWARTLLKGLGLLSNERRSQWSLTASGAAISEADLRSTMSQAAKKPTGIGQPTDG